jgi:hypothetical protein
MHTKFCQNPFIHFLHTKFVQAGNTCEEVRFVQVQLDEVTDEHVQRITNRGNMPQITNLVVFCSCVTECIKLKI